MRSFQYAGMPKVYFGEGSLKAALEKELAGTGENVLLAYGGGSVIDCCKIVSAQAKTDEDIWDMEFHQHRFPTEFVPMGAVTTVSGTGSEMNSGAVITNTETKQKNGMGGALAQFAVLDPSYTLTVPMKQVISGAFDTLSHCMETYFGKPSEVNVSDEMNEAVMRNVIRNIRAAIHNPADLTDPEILRKVADTAIITPGCARQLGRDELYQILTECI